MTKLTIKFIMITSKNLIIIFIIFISSILLNSCGGKLPGADARKYDPDPKKRVIFKFLNEIIINLIVNFIFLYNILIKMLKI